ncbi:MAG: hypothetical protein QOE59_3730 [Actinomycetota bacterium]|jgi:hypothetical protein|nr:hypothetical protein [Actinomycetota bacterium]
MDESQVDSGVTVRDLQHSTSLGSDVELRALRAARYAAAAYPGAVGELISREIRAYVNAGRALSPAALEPRLVSAMQRAEIQDPLPPIRSESGHHLAARPVPGRAMQWRYPTVADELDLDPGGQ